MIIEMLTTITGAVFLQPLFCAKKRDLLKDPAKVISFKKHQALSMYPERKQEVQILILLFPPLSSFTRTDWMFAFHILFALL